MSQNVQGPNSGDPTTRAANIGRVPNDGAKPRALGAPDSGESTPAFKALLEKLEQHAQELKATGAGELDVERLSGAVDQARETLHDALGLGDQLLEAYRQAMHQNPNTEQGGSR